MAATAEQKAEKARRAALKKACAKALRELKGAKGTYACGAEPYGEWLLRNFGSAAAYKAGA